VMEKDVPILPAETQLDEFLIQSKSKGAIRHIVITHAGRIFGVQRINTRIRNPLAHTQSGVTLGAVAQKNFTIVREREVMFDVITRMSRKDATMALVVSAQAGRAPRPEHVLGVITKEHVADSVAKSVNIYPG
jgi:chloride channel protein, CIC family